METIKNKIKFYWKETPLQFVVITAILIRVLAAIFAKGFGMHDDAYGPVQSPQELLDGGNIIDDLSSEPRQLLYPAIQFITFFLCETVGIYDPQVKMLVVRLLHAFYSVFTIYYAYKITIIISNEDNAKKVGMFLALFWLLPFMSVRNLVEMVCIPPLMAGIYYILRNEKKSDYLWGGILLGFAFVFRTQTAIFPLGLGIVLLFRKEFAKLAILTISFCTLAFLILGIPEWLLWGQPFKYFLDYFVYNSTHSYDYITLPWYNYLLLLFGILIPPLSILLLFGFVRTYKTQILLFLPTLLFLAFHSYYPNKQERFILPMLPVLVILCVVGWEKFRENSHFWQKHSKMLKGFWLWFWVINSILLIFLSFNYSKRTRVESMYCLYGKEVNSVLIFNGKHGDVTLPTFYAGKKFPLISVNENDSAEIIFKKIIDSKTVPNYAIFFGDEELYVRINKYEKEFDENLVFVDKFQPSLIDYTLYLLNPKHNKNETANVYFIQPKKSKI